MHLKTLQTIWELHWTTQSCSATEIQTTTGRYDLMQILEGF